MKKRIEYIVIVMLTGFLLLYNSQKLQAQNALTLDMDNTERELGMIAPTYNNFIKLLEANIDSFNSAMVAYKFVPENNGYTVRDTYRYQTIKKTTYDIEFSWDYSSFLNKDFNAFLKSLKSDLMKKSPKVTFDEETETYDYEIIDNTGKHVYNIVFYRYNDHLSINLTKWKIY